MSRLLRLALLAGCAFALPLGAQQTLTPRPGPLQFSVTAPQGASIAQGLTTQLVAKRWLLRGSTQTVDVTNAVIWSSLDPAIASVDGSGLVPGNQTGDAFIRSEEHTS